MTRATWQHPCPRCPHSPPSPVAGRTQPSITTVPLIQALSYPGCRDPDLRWTIIRRVHRTPPVRSDCAPELVVVHGRCTHLQTLQSRYRICGYTWLRARQARGNGCGTTWTWYQQPVVYCVAAARSGQGFLRKDPHTSSLHVVSSNHTFVLSTLAHNALLFFDRAHCLHPYFPGVRMEGWD